VSIKNEAAFASAAHTHFSLGYVFGSNRIAVYGIVHGCSLESAASAYGSGAQNPYAF
jgi:hypothetical protein